VLICTEGAATLSDSDGATLKLCRGESAWLSAADCAADPVLARPVGGGRTQLFRATAGQG
jgi:hypothetical protein